MLLPNLSALSLQNSTGPIFKYQTRPSKRLKPSEQEGDKEEEAEDEENAPSVCPIDREEPAHGEDVYQLPGQTCKNPAVYNIPALYAWLRMQEQQDLDLTDPLTRQKIPPAEWKAIKEWMREHRPGSVAPEHLHLPAPAIGDGGDAPFAALEIESSFDTTPYPGTDVYSDFKIALKLSAAHYPRICALLRHYFSIQRFANTPEYLAFTRLMPVVAGQSAADSTSEQGLETFLDRVKEHVETLIRSSNPRYDDSLFDFTDSLRISYGPIGTIESGHPPKIEILNDHNSDVTLHVTYENISRQTYDRLAPSFPGGNRSVETTNLGPTEVFKFLNMITTMVEAVYAEEEWHHVNIAERRDLQHRVLNLENARRIHFETGPAHWEARYALRRQSESE
jgi:hypothetical protein